MKNKGFTFIELIIVLITLSILSIFAFAKYNSYATQSRIQIIDQLYSSVLTGVRIVKSKESVQTAFAGGIVWLNMDGVNMRIWNGYPDRWCDGIGLVISNANIPIGGCYLSTAAISLNNYTFYGYNNTTIPGRNAGWRINTAPNPTNCSVSYQYNGTGIPIITKYTSGC